MSNSVCDKLMLRGHNRWFNLLNTSLHRQLMRKTRQYYCQNDLIIQSFVKKWHFYYFNESCGYFSKLWFVCNNVLCVWISSKVSTSVEYTQLALASTLWLTVYKRGPIRARAQTVALAPLSVCVHKLASSPLETPSLSSRDVLHLAVHPSCGEEAAGLEEVDQRPRRSGWWGAERPRGEMVREGCEEPSEEVEEDRPARWAGESYHHTELQHQVCHHPQVYCSNSGLLLLHLFL